MIGRITRHNRMYSKIITTYSGVWMICMGYGEDMMRGTPG